MIAVVLASACGSDIETVRTPTDVSLDLVVRSAQVPYSRNSYLAVPAPGRACLVDSYNVRIVCGGRSWAEPDTFSREGSGPGEIDGCSLLSTPDGSLVCVDLGNSRVTVFSDSLRYVESVRLPILAAPAEDLATDTAIALVRPPSRAQPNLLDMAWLSLTSDSVARERRFEFDDVTIDGDTVTLTGASVTRSGDLILRAGLDHLAWFTPSGRLIDVASLPDFGPVYPTEGEVERWVAFHRMTGRRPTDAEIEAFRKQPVGRTDGSVNTVIETDARGRVWVRTTRPSDAGTYLAVYRERRYVGSLEIAGRVIDFEIADSLLVALVESVRPDSVGLHPRRVDWYRIVEVTDDGSGSEAG